VEGVPERPKTPDEQEIERLTAEGVLLAPEGPSMSDGEAQEIERELEDIARANPNMGDAAELVFEDREGGW
jgi:hypothetical protein